MSGQIHTQVIPIDFGDADMAGILYFPRLFHLCHVSMEGLVHSVLGIRYATLLTERNLGFPTVHVEADYHKPLPYGHDVDVGMTVRRMGDKSIGFRWRFRLTDGDGALRAEARSTVVCARMDQFESVSIPDDVRAAFAPFVEADAENEDS